MSNSELGQAAQKEKNEMYSIKNIGRVAGFLYLFIDILSLFSISHAPADLAQTATVWLAISLVLEGLVGRVEVLGGIWVLLVTWAALRKGGLPRSLNYLGLTIGAAGILSVVPALDALGVGFRLGEIVWVVWLGIVISRGSRSAVARKFRAFFAVGDVSRGEAGRRIGFCKLIDRIAAKRTQNASVSSGKGEK